MWWYASCLYVLHARLARVVPALTEAPSVTWPALQKGSVESYRLVPVWHEVMAVVAIHS
jgi:hypothetical protein